MFEPISSKIRVVSLICLTLLLVGTTAGCLYGDVQSGGYKQTNILPGDSVYLMVDSPNPHTTNFSTASISVQFSVGKDLTTSWSYDFIRTEQLTNRTKLVYSLAQKDIGKYEHYKFKTQPKDFKITLEFNSNDPYVHQFDFFNGTSTIEGNLTLAKFNTSLNVIPAYHHGYNGLKNLTTEDPVASRHGNQSIYIQREDCTFKIVNLVTVLNPYV